VRIASAISALVPKSRCAPETSQNASSSEIVWTRGVNAPSTSRNVFDAVVYASKSGDTNTASGHNRRARIDGMPLRTPFARASYEHESTTPRPPAPPTITGLPKSDGSRRRSTDT
jgi:hypothetical protein